MDSVNWQEIHLHNLSTASSNADFFKVLAGIASELGFDYCAYGMRVPVPVTQPKMLLLNNYSTEWQERYVSQNYLAVDPTVRHGMNSVEPLIWAESGQRNSSPFWSDALDHGLRVGWAQSSFDARGVVGMLTLARSGEELMPKELQANALKMSWLVQAAHSGMMRLQAGKQLPAVLSAKLTSRETEVLRWTADGKTSSEVGQIMGISERTVNFHVNNSLEKLGAANKTAGVVLAALLRLL